MDIDFGLTNYQQKKMNWGNFTKVKRIGTNIKKKNRLVYWLVRKDVYAKPTLHSDTNERKGIVFYAVLHFTVTVVLEYWWNLQLVEGGHLYSRSRSI